MTVEKKEHKYHNPNKISVSPDNPRGEKEEKIKKSPRFKALVTSIKEFGVLEPLIVKRDETGTDNYILVDGERRLIASREAELDEVPILIESNVHDARILAYQIHMLRENWSKITETKAIKKIISDIKEDKPDIKESEIRTILKSITAHTNDEISDLMKLIKYDEKTIEKSISGQIQPSYLIQIESSFISRLKKEYPAIIETYSEEKIRKIMVRKVLNKLLGNTRFLMDQFKIVFKDAQNKKEISRLIDEFLKTKTKNLEDTLEEYKSLVAKKKQAKPTRKKKAKKKAKKDKKKSAEQETFSYRYIKITSKQQTRFQDIKDRLDSIANLLTDEELEYVSEAVFCLKDQYLKAATLMIWAAGVSRILNYIEGNIKDFNMASVEMYKKKKSVYRHIAKDFQKNAESVEDIREHGNDKQLLSYLLYRNFLDVPQCNKMFGNYKTRCDCAHPTSIKLRVNGVIEIFEDVISLILTNDRLK